MPQIVQSGSINTTALIVPDLYVQIVPPQNLVINGVPTNVLGVVGTASWGPVGKAAIVANMAEYAALFGPVMNRKYDMGTGVALAVQQGAQNFRCVRVTDGTDAAASVAIGSTDLTVTSLYTGSFGNNFSITLSNGSKAGTVRAVIGASGLVPEVYDNIPGSFTAWASSTAYIVGQVVGVAAGNFYVCTTAGTSAVSGTGPTGTGSGITDGSATWKYVSTVNGFWEAVASAINSGSSVLRPPSAFVTATAGVGTSLPSASTYALAGGADGVTSVTQTSLIGTDVSNSAGGTGMYALRKQGCSVAFLADCDLDTTWTTQAAFGLNEGIYMVAVAAAGSPIQNGTDGTVDLKQAAGLDSYAVTLMHGDWLYWQDNVNNVVRLVSPQGVKAGLLCNMSPQNSTLNKQVYGVIGSQKSGLATQLNTTYADAELQTLIQNGIEVICNPQPGGTYWGCRSGHNSSSNASVNGDNYTRMTNYIAATLAAGMGQYVGLPVSTSLFTRIRSTMLAYFAGLVMQGLLDATYGLPYSVICDTSNNPQSRTGIGYVQADTQVRYMGINEKFIVNLEGGSTVVVTNQSQQQGSAASSPL